MVPALAAVRYGSGGPDRLRGTGSADALHGLGGNDTILAGAGDDRHRHDRIVGCGPGNDLAILAPGDRPRNCERIRR